MHVTYYKYDMGVLAILLNVHSNVLVHPSYLYFSTFRDLYIYLFACCVNNRPTGIERPSTMETRFYDPMADIIWNPHCIGVCRSYYGIVPPRNSMAIIATGILQPACFLPLAAFEFAI